jgi:hypothetical protein
MGASAKGGAREGRRQFPPRRRYDDDGGTTTTRSEPTTTRERGHQSRLLECVPAD